MTCELVVPSLDDIRAAQKRLRPLAMRTPLIRLNVDDAPAEIYLKLENLQPIGSFKIRPAGSAILNAPRHLLAEGIYTASSGNMAQGVTYVANTLGVPATVLLPQNPSAIKVDALQRLGANIRELPFDEWWNVILEHRHPREKGFFIHPVAQQDVLAGDATVGLEILEDLPDVETVLVPYGGGGLSCGIASALRAMESNARVLAAESAHAAPLLAALEAGKPVEIPYPHTFVSGIGNGGVLEEMWPLVDSLLAGSVVAGLDEIAAAIRMIFERHRVIAEGAGAAPVAAALAGRAGCGKIVCVVSGGNLDRRYLIDILQGNVPEA